MKKLLLIATSALLAVGASAEYNVGENQEPTWTLTVKRTDVEPNGDGDVHTLTATGTQIGGSDVYAATVALDVVGENKPAKYWLTVTYTSADGATTYSAAYSKSAYQLQAPAQPITLTVGASLQGDKNIRAVYSINSYCIGDANYRALAVFQPSVDGSAASCYFNAPLARNEFKPAGNINYGSTTDQYTTGASVNTISFPTNKVAQGVYKATMDYAKTTIAVEKVNTLDVNIDGLYPFTAPAEVTLPEGVTAYTLTYGVGENLPIPTAAEDADATSVLIATEVEGNVIAANTPVLLKAEAGTYTLALGDTYAYTLDNEGKMPTFMFDTKGTDTNLLVGVNQPHYLPEACYVLEGDTFKQWKEADNTDEKGNVSRLMVNQFTAYVALPAEVTDAPATLAIQFPKEEEVDGIENVSIADSYQGPAYNLQGIPVDDNYKGIVIRNGKKYIQR